MERKIKKEERHFNDSCQEAADSHLIPVYSKHQSSSKKTHPNHQVMERNAQMWLMAQMKAHDPDEGI